MHFALPLAPHFPRRAFGDIRPFDSGILCVKNSTTENLYFRQFEKEEHNSGGLVLYMQEEWGEHRSSSSTL
jgi:hypothetical protein